MCLKRLDFTKATKQTSEGLLKLNYNIVKYYYRFSFVQ